MKKTTTITSCLQNNGILWKPMTFYFFLFLFRSTRTAHHEKWWIYIFEEKNHPDTQGVKKEMNKKTVRKKKKKCVRGGGLWRRRKRKRRGKTEGDRRGCKMEPYWVGGLCVSLQQRGRTIIVTNDVSSADCEHRTTLSLCKSQAQGPLNNILRRSGNVRQPC